MCWIFGNKSESLGYNDYAWASPEGSKQDQCKTTCATTSTSALGDDDGIEQLVPVVPHLYIDLAWVDGRYALAPLFEKGIVLVARLGPVRGAHVLLASAVVKGLVGTDASRRDLVSDGLNAASLSRRTTGRVLRRPRLRRRRRGLVLV